MQTFNYNEAFSRNLGFLSPQQQEKLRSSRVAVAGLGGTGGAQLHPLARMGIGKFTISDPDTFEVVNFNRQANATMETLGRNKAVVGKESILSINPKAEVKDLGLGIRSANVQHFLFGADVVV